MKPEYKDYAKSFKALSDPTRLLILDMISCNAMCACDILERVEIGQSTLSYHMKILVENNLVFSKAEGSWMWYSSNKEKMTEITNFLTLVSMDKDPCICKTTDKETEKEESVCQCQIKND